MTLRENIADIILGGGLSAMYEQMKSAMRKASIERRRADEARLERDIARIALRRIVSLETPNMAHVGKKAVKLAKEGLGE